MCIDYALHNTYYKASAQTLHTLDLPAEGHIHLQAPVRLAWLPETRVQELHVFRPPLPPSRNMLESQILQLQPRNFVSNNLEPMFL